MMPFLNHAISMTTPTDGTRAGLYAWLSTFTHRYMLADSVALSTSERRRSALGAILGVVACGLALQALPLGAHWLIAPLGASAVIVFALSHSPLAQPWSLLGGYLSATLAGLACAMTIPWPAVAAGLSVGLTIWLMARFNCFHPPGGAVALFLVLDGPYTLGRIGVTLALIAVNLACILLAALIVNRYALGRVYPFTGETARDNTHRTRDPTPMGRIGLSHEDLEHAVRQLDAFVDVQERELVQLYNLAVDHAFDRHAGLNCGAIMSRDIVTVEFGTELEDAWKLLRAHKVKALPVVDSFGRLIGILSVADYLRQMDDTTAAGLAIRLQGLLRRTPGPTSEKAEVVGQIMTARVDSARLDTPISKLADMLSDGGMHHIPVVDESKRVVGMVTQSDIIAALYKQLALSMA
jgi:CBS domain-containing membrane protein